MAFVFNVGKGRVRQLVADGATIKCLLLKTAEADADLKDRDSIQDILDQAGNVEADFTNYARQTLAGLSITVDDVTNRTVAKHSDVTWVGAGGAVNNTLAVAIFYLDVDGTDPNAVPLTGHQYVVTTDGTDLLLRCAEQGFWRSQDGS